MPFIRHLLYAHCTGLSAIKVLLTATANLLGKPCYCSHFPDEGTGPDRAHGLSSLERDGAGTRSSACVTLEPGATQDSATALIPATHPIGRPLCLICGRQGPAHQLGKVHSGLEIFKCY